MRRGRTESKHRNEDADRELLTTCLWNRFDNGTEAVEKLLEGNTSYSDLMSKDFDWFQKEKTRTGIIWLTFSIS